MPVPALDLNMPDYGKVTREQRVSQVSSFIRWVQLKKYQYEVTFSLYMLTPTEKFIFNLILFILVSLLVTAASLYLPNHVAVIYNRLWYYLHGDFAYAADRMVVDKAALTAAAADQTSQLLRSGVSSTLDALGGATAATLKEL